MVLVFEQAEFNAVQSGKQSSSLGYAVGTPCELV